MKDLDKYNPGDADYFLRECVSTIKAGIDQIYFGISSLLTPEDEIKLIEHIKNQTDSLQDVLYKSIVEKANKIDTLNSKLVKTNKELTALKFLLEKKVISRTKTIKRTQEVTIFSLARLAESRDPETGNHLNRIREYCRFIASKLYEKRTFPEDITKEFISDIYHSSPLHDIGKVGIRDSILRKKGSLSDEEFTIMKKHTVIGGKTLEMAEKKLRPRSRSFLTMGKNIAYAHHERFDGKGYPFQLKREEIPIEARITSLADIFDALRSKRVYKDEIDHETTKDIILQERGKQLDPRIVDIFEEYEEDFKAINSKYY